MHALVFLGAGFLVAVLWFDLMFDVQVRGHARDEPLPEPVLDSIGGYYRRVTTDAAPMNRLVSLGMLATLLGIGLQAALDDVAVAVTVASVLLAVPPIALAGARVFPAAKRLGTAVDPPETRSGLARAIFRDHVFCLGSISALLVLQAGVALAG